MPRVGNISLPALYRYAHCERSLLCQRCGALTEAGIGLQNSRRARQGLQGILESRTVAL